MARIANPLLALSLAAMLYGCAVPVKPEEFFQPVSLAQQQFKSQMFETGNEVDIMRACANVLMDNNFQVHEAESQLGWISAGKSKAAPGLMPVAVRATVLVSPAAGRPGMSFVRLSLLNVDDADIYQELFARIAQLLFVRAQPL